MVGAETYVISCGEEDEGEAYVEYGSDEWDSIYMGEADGWEAKDLAASIKARAWYPVPADAPEMLEEFSHLRLRQLGCADPQVLDAARRFDREG